MMPAMPKWLERVLNSVANLFQIFGLSVSVGAVVVILLSFWSGAIHWLQEPNVYVPAFTFAFFFFVYTAIKTRVVRFVPEYEHAVAVEGGWAAVLAQFPADDASHGSESALTLLCRFRNVCTAPLRVKVEEFDVRLDGRAYGHSQNTLEFEWQRLSTKTINSPLIVRDPAKQNLIGAASVKLLYGPLRKNAKLFDGIH